MEADKCANCSHDSRYHGPNGCEWADFETKPIGTWKNPFTGEIYNSYQECKCFHCECPKCIDRLNCE